MDCMLLSPYRSKRNHYADNTTYDSTSPAANRGGCLARLYDDVFPIEHEDSLMAPEEGLHKASRFLQKIIIHEKPMQAWWA